MTITSATNRVSFAGDGSTTVFSFAFPITVGSDLKVVLRDASGNETPQVIATNYTVSAAPYTSGGAVTMLAAPAVGITLFIIGNLPVTQPLNLQDGGPLPAGSANGAWDRAVMLIRQLTEKVGRALVLRDTDTYGSGKLDGGANEISNIAPGTGPSSAATVAQVGNASGTLAIAVPQVWVASIAALQAVITTVFGNAFLTQSGRVGTFVWTTGDYSARIAADTQQGVYIKASAIAATVGAWVRAGDWPQNGVAAEWFGAIGDANPTRAAANTTAINAAISLASTLAKASPATAAAYVRFGPGTFVVNPITILTRVILKGAGQAVTEIYLANNSNDHLAKSQNFVSLSGTNKWLETDGVATLIGFKDIRFNGNKANQSAGNGLSLYAKGLFFDGCVIINCKGHGLYSECGEDPTVSTWDNWPEGDTGLLQIGGCDGNGWLNRGPHDLSAKKVMCLINGGNGVNIESVAGQYLATCSIPFIHSYANTGRGLYIFGSSNQIGMARLEDNGGEGLYLQSASNNLFDMMQLFDNCKTTGSYQGVIDATSSANSVKNLLARTIGRAAAGGFQIRGSKNILEGRIVGDVTGGGNSTSAGLDIDACGFNNIDVCISDFSGAGGIGLKTQPTTQLFWTSIKAVLSNCDTLWTNTVVGANNHFDITGQCTASQTRFTGVGPQTGQFVERWNVDLNKNTVGTLSSKWKASGALNLNITTEQSISIALSLLATPKKEDVRVTLSCNGAPGATVAVIQYMYIRSDTLSATNATVVAKLSTALGLAFSADLSVEAAL